MIYRGLLFPFFPFFLDPSTLLRPFWLWPEPVTFPIAEKEALDGSERFNWRHGPKDARTSMRSTLKANDRRI
ncbi:hypothetical protein F4775DRAFT_574701 [Biscogniauxia sp. FL1348]|nr:hypothetical protein F4775DRAFT_574701 [Biscogniauxia sp. FL1348]